MLKSQKLLQEALLECSNLVLKRMDELLPQSFNDSRLIEAMRYSALSDGKRIRPFLLLTSAEIFGVAADKALNAAVAIEFIHAYSLIHDDLPAMDNDDFRRGIPTNHKKFNEATAILAGDSLLTYAFEILADESTHQNPTTRCELIKTLAKASGFMGMAGGQMIDLETAQQKISKEKLLHLHRLKTGELFIASAKMGAILGNATIEEKSALQNFAHDFGLAFQIKDDILDHQEAGKNESLENASIVDLLGLKEAEQQLELLKNQANSHLKIFGERASLLQELFNFMANRLK